MKKSYKSSIHVLNALRHHGWRDIHHSAFICAQRLSASRMKGRRIPRPSWRTSDSAQRLSASRMKGPR